MENLNLNTKINKKSGGDEPQAQQAAIEASAEMKRLQEEDKRKKLWERHEELIIALVTRREDKECRSINQKLQNLAASVGKSFEAIKKLEQSLPKEDVPKTPRPVINFTQARLEQLQTPVGQPSKRNNCTPLSTEDEKKKKPKTKSPEGDSSVPQDES